MPSSTSLHSPTPTADGRSPSSLAGTANAWPSPSSHWLEVRDGQTVDRIRPLLADRVLIGSGSSCHIQIASHEVAMVHAVLVRETSAPLGGWSIEALAEHPAVLVNGEVVRRRTLEHDDLIGLAGVNLAFQVAGCVASGDDDHAEQRIEDTLSEEDLASLLAEEKADVFRPAAVSASELVDAIEHELNLIAELAEDQDSEPAPAIDAEPSRLPPPAVPRDPSRPRGLGALLSAAQTVQDDAAKTVSIPIRRSVIVPLEGEDRKVA